MIITVLTVLALYGYGCRLIFNGVETYTRDAQATYGGEPAMALIALVEDESASFEKRNSAIWALGQLGDKRALLALHKLDTGEIQNPPYDSTAYIVQYSVEKAISQINRFSIVRWMYRWLD
ncbi:hypothetical protein PDESU_04662 [Pontiella desulfatans]|uniref:HEAT repeat domain-containing protein n=2 Tax=Pontiella desulfatans TaxID=2750659 RepID=A0A6C2U7K0_PONDE|nr:hypothetical protein PDESU_04662 [Pontiella desulfatans]